MARNHSEIREQLAELGYIPFFYQGVLRLGKYKQAGNLNVPQRNRPLTTTLYNCPAMSNLKECLRHAKTAENR